MRGDRRVSTALPTSFYARPAAVVARELLGARLVSQVGGRKTAGVIVETEAYTGPEDEASHAHERFGRTARNAMMFAAPGLAYVYRIYGIHWCLNAVTDGEDFPAAVLIRAARPAEGMEWLGERRKGRPEVEWMRGPGKLSEALGIEGSLNGHSLERSPLWIEPGEAVPPEEVAVGPRIGISRAVDEPLRFWVRGSPYVSRLPATGRRR